MKFEWFIARRYLTRGRKNSFISIISLVSILGISIGVAALIIALSLINGFQNDIRDRILSSSAHVMISDHFGEGIGDYPKWVRLFQGKFKEVKRVSPVVFGTVLIKGPLKEVSGAIFRGMDLSQPGNEPWLDRPEFGRLPADSRELIIGREMAVKMNLAVGDSCMIITPQPVLSPSGLIPRFRKFRVAGIFKSGLFEFDNGTIIARLDAAQALFGLEKRISYLQINLHDLFDAERVAAGLRRMLPGQFSIVTWRELNESLYSALKLEKTVLFFTLSLIVVVASLNIVAGLILLVIQKIRDIGILLSFGTGPRLIRRIFFIQGGVIGLIGTGVGVAFGLLFCSLANRFQLIRVPSDIYQVGYVPFRVETFDLAAVIVASLLISLCATLIPSKKAAAVTVVDAVKYE